MKKYVIYVAAFVLGAALGAGVVLKSCGPGKAYWIERAKYDAEIKVRDAAIVESAARQAALEAEKVALQGAVESAQAAIDVKLCAIADRDKRIAELEAAEPVAPELETHPLVINLRAQIAEWKGKFSLAQGAIVEKDKIIFSLRGQLAVQMKLTEEWKANYEREYALRLTSDGLRLGLEKKLYGGKIWKTVALVEPPVFGILAMIFK